MTDLFDPNKLIETTETVDETKDYLAELVGEGKKFADANALAKGKAQSDLFVKRLEAENKQMRDELARQAAELKTRTSLDEFLQKVKEQKETGNTPDNQNDQTVLNEEKISQLIETRLTAKEQAAIATANLKTVQEGLVKAYGANYLPNLEARTQELGLSKETLDNLAKTAPKAFFALLGINPDQSKKSVFEAPRGTVNPPHDTHGVTKNYKYYNELRKKLPPDQYWSPAVQNEMFEMAKKMGDEFYS